LPALAHGGDLGAARAQFPDAPEPFIDLSTGINPFPYPFRSLPAHAFTRLPQPEDLARLTAIAAKAYGAPSPEHVVPAPGMQILLPMSTGLLAPARAAVLGPTYSEHARIAALVGHSLQEVSDLQQLAEAELAIVVNPNNPDGRIACKHNLLELAEKLRARCGLLIVDEAFMEAASSEHSLASEVGRRDIVVLRSFGKFYGLPGVRLAFALTAPRHAARMRAWLGPWPVSGAALAMGQMALADAVWTQDMREKLRAAATRLDALLSSAALEVIGGTLLFRLVRTDFVADLFDRLGRAGIYVRRFAEQPKWLRFGLPCNKGAWERLATALPT
jgi:cobalamin biosynthetic protein CobC